MSANSASNAGQRHDRIQRPDLNITLDAETSNVSNMDSDIPITQKMLSAVSGSVLTSLLGTQIGLVSLLPAQAHQTRSTNSFRLPVTPLDVVRVRLQSQHNPSTTPNPADFRPTSSPLSGRPFSKLPPNLGVTACCREVFWITNNAPFCIADSSAAANASASTLPSYLNPTTATSQTECLIQESRQKKFTTTLDGLRKIARNEGITTLWRGLSPTLLMSVPGNVIYFAGYDWLRTSRISPLSTNRIVNENYAPLVAGSSARVFAALFVSPIELFRTRMQAAHHAHTAAGHFRETLSGVREMVQSQGVLTLWRGLTLTLWRDVPFSALYWWGYEAVRNILTDTRQSSLGAALASAEAVSRRRAGSRSRQNHASTLVDSFVAGATSGAVASVVTTPFDVGKTRQQVYRHSGDSARAGAAEEAGQVLKSENRSMMHFLWQIGREEGLAGLFRGWIPRVMKVAPACAIMISSYEMGKKMAQGAKREGDEEV